MTEFSNRIDAQRNILKIVNAYINKKEHLLGLSGKAIERWCSINQISSETELVEKITEVSRKLFFLANKSQEQVTNEYKSISHEISYLTNTISDLLADGFDKGVHQSKNTPL